MKKKIIIPIIIMIFIAIIAIIIYQSEINKNNITSNQTTNLNSNNPQIPENTINYQNNEQRNNEALEETNIAIEMGDTTVYGTLNNTELANEIKQMFPITVTMGRFGTREFYGGISQTPTSTGEGKRNFENGDITYCPTNNTLAIFYNQSDRPNLSMDVITIGKVTSDLAIFEEIDSSIQMEFKVIE